MHTLINLGCPMKSVSEIIRCCTNATGAILDVVPNHHTVWRAIIKGGLASQAQIIYELWNAKGGYVLIVIVQTLTLHRFCCEWGWHN